MAVFSVVATCFLLEVYRPYRGAYYPIPLMSEAARKSVKLKETIRCNIPKDGSNLHGRRHENLKSHLETIRFTTIPTAVLYCNTEQKSGRI
jgi:hypothetical protein